MAAPEVLGGGPALEPGTPLEAQVQRAAERTRRRRQVGVLASAAALVGAGVLASRTTADPYASELPPPPALTAAVTAPPDLAAAVAARRPRGAVGSERVYGLIAPCASLPSGAPCSYRLVRRAVDGGGWTTAGLPPLPVEPGTSTPWVFVTGADAVTVVERGSAGRVFMSTDGGETFTARPTRVGPPVAAVPVDAVLVPRLCIGCPGPLTALEPATGRYRRLTDPPVEDIRSYAMRGDVIWVAGMGDRRVITAVSRDRGRHWRVLTVGGLQAPVDQLRVVPALDGGAYLIVGRNERRDVGNEFSELWQLTGRGVVWVEVTPEERPGSVGGAVAGERGLLVSEEDGGVWRLLGDRSMRRLPDPVVGGRLVKPGRLVTGPGGVVLGWPLGDAAPFPLVSYDEGESWLADPLPR